MQHLATDSFEHITVNIIRKKTGESHTVTGLNSIEVNRPNGKYKEEVTISSDAKVAVRELQPNYRAGVINLVVNHHSPSLEFFTSLDTADPKDDLVSISITDTMAKRKWSAQVAWQSTFSSAKLEVTKGERTFAFVTPHLKMDQVA